MSVQVQCLFHQKSNLQTAVQVMPAHHTQVNQAGVVAQHQARPFDTLCGVMSVQMPAVADAHASCLYIVGCRAFAF